MGFRHSNATRRRERTISLPIKTWNRIRFLHDLRKDFDEHETVDRAVNALDRIECAHLEGSKIVIEHKDGTRELW